MRRTVIIAAAVGVAATMAIWALRPSAGSAVVGKLADHALIDQTGGDTMVRCRTTNSSPFIVYGSFRAFGGAVTMRVLFQDGDFVDYPLAQDQVFSFQQAAGDTNSVDDRIRVTTAPGSAGDLVGWMSASRAPGSASRVICNTFQ
jgi:hypothetical protein